MTDLIIWGADVPLALVALILAIKRIPMRRVIVPAQIQPKDREGRFVRNPKQEALHELLRQAVGK
jgi:hypothetical protein